MCLISCVRTRNLVHYGRGALERCKRSSLPSRNITNFFGSAATRSGRIFVLAVLCVQYLHDHSLPWIGASPVVGMTRSQLRSKLAFYSWRFNGLFSASSNGRHLPRRRVLVWFVHQRTTACSATTSSAFFQCHRWYGNRPFTGSIPTSSETSGWPLLVIS